MKSKLSATELQNLAQQIHRWGSELGFQKLGISDTQLNQHEQHLLNWLDAGFHGEMDFMQRHGNKRSRPQKLLSGTLRIISVRMDYYPPQAAASKHILNSPELGFVSRYALGRDYHKLIRTRLQRLADRIQNQIGAFGYRAFCDSAPVLEKAIATKAGLGWIGKHSNLLSESTGSWFFLGELYTDLPLPVDASPVVNRCGSCTACLDCCPTQAIVAPYRVDARRCISYLTIELKGSIPEVFRQQIGNRIYGCDDCQLVCPWNRFATPTEETAFYSRHRLDQTKLSELFRWSEQEFFTRTAGSPIRRIGYERWLRNIAVALGNAPSNHDVIAALREKQHFPSALVREHVNWALQQHAAYRPRRSQNFPHRARD